MGCGASSRLGTPLHFSSATGRDMMTEDFSVPTELFTSATTNSNGHLSSGVRGPQPPSSSSFGARGWETGSTASSASCSFSTPCSFGTNQLSTSPRHPLWATYVEEQKQRHLASGWEHVQFAAWVFDPQLRRVVFANARAVQLFGCHSLEELMRRDFANDAQAVRDYAALCAEAFQNGQRSCFCSPLPHHRSTGFICITPYTMHTGRMCLLCTVFDAPLPPSTGANGSGPGAGHAAAPYAQLPSATMPLPAATADMTPLAQAIATIGVPAVSSEATRRSLQAFQHAPVMITAYDAQGKAVCKNWKAETVIGKALLLREREQNRRGVCGEGGVDTTAVALAAGDRNDGALPITPGTTTGTLLATFMPHATDREAIAQLAHELESGKEVHTKVQISRSSGVRWHLVHANRTRDPVTGEPITVVTEEDVTELDRLFYLTKNLLQRIGTMDLDTMEEMIQQFYQHTSANLFVRENAEVLESAFTHLLASLKEFRPFVPPAVLVQDGQQQLYETRKNSSFNTPGAAGAAGAAGGGVTSPMSRRGSHSSGESADSGRRSSCSGDSASRSSRTTRMGLQFRDVTLMIVTLNDFHHFIQTATSAVEAVILTFTSILERTILSSRGTIHFLNGEHCFVSWNVVHPLFTHTGRACTCALNLHQALGAALAGFGLSISIVVGSGRELVGNVSRSKSFHVIGNLYRQLQVVERWNRQRLRCPMVVTQETYRDAHYAFSFKPVDMVSLDGVERVALYELLGGANTGVANDEWMYELQASHRTMTQHQTEYHVAFQKMADGDFDGALAALDRHLVRYPTDPHALRMRSACSEHQLAGSGNYCIQLGRRGSNAMP